MIDRRDSGFSLVAFLPEVIKHDPEIIALSLALDPELRSVGAAIIEANILPRIAEVAEWVLDELAWAFRLNRLQLWDDATPDAKRSLLVNIFAIRKKSGTRFAVRRVFDLLSVDGVLVEWFEEGAQPHTYRLRLILTDQPITKSQLVQIGELVRRFARKSQKLREFAIEANPSGPVYVYPAITIGRHTTIAYGGS